MSSIQFHSSQRGCEMKFYGCSTTDRKLSPFVLAEKTQPHAIKTAGTTDVKSTLTLEQQLLLHVLPLPKPERQVAQQQHHGSSYIPWFLKLTWKESLKLDKREWGSRACTPTRSIHLPVRELLSPRRNEPGLMIIVQERMNCFSCSKVCRLLSEKLSRLCPLCCAPLPESQTIHF